MLRVDYIEDNIIWNKALESFKSQHFLQTSQWAQIKDSYGWTPIKVALYKEEELIAVCLILKKIIPIIKSSILYCPRGPIFNSKNSNNIEDILKTLRKIAIKENAVSIKIDAELKSSDNTWISSLKSLRWKKSSEVQFRNTAVVDLTPSLDEIQTNMKKKGRYNIKVALKKNVEIKQDDSDIPVFFEQYTNTGIRNKFITRTTEYYTHVAKTFIDTDKGTLFSAYHENDYLAGAFIVTQGKTAWYFYGSSSNNKRNYMPTYLLHWEIIKWAKSNGYTKYDMWGAPEKLSEDDPMWGVYKFKENLGANFREQAGAYDLTLKPITNFFVNKVIPLIQTLKKKLR